jgi:Carboxypeptidase regulatory-like domain/TonB-dependent Receptor Plug Domain
MMNRKSYAALLVVGLLSSAGAAAAQEFRATIKGQVLDSSQGALPGATVSVTNAETNEVATATTNAEGNYTVPFLRPGLYTLTVELPGFQKYTRSGMRLEVSQTATINVQLAVGGLAEEVNVSAESPLLETSNANRGTVIDNKRIAELPLQSRSPMALAVLVAGVNYNAQAIYLRPFDNGALADWSMNGGANRNNEFLMDGVPNNANINGNNIAYVPPAEALQEFKIATNTYDAQYGRTAGGVINMSLKSGTNTFHGVGYEFYRRKWLDANSFFLNARNSPKTDHYLDQYGFSVDGPVILPKLYNGKNKTFFLFVGEKYREGTPAPQTGTTPTDAMKNGDFSNYRDSAGNLITIYDPRTGRDLNGVWTRDPFPGNRIPADRIDPVARQLLQYYPSPNNVDPAVAPWQNNLAYPEHFNKDVFWNWVGKVDHNFGPNDRFFARWGRNERNEIRNTTAIRSGPAQNGQLPLIRWNDAIVADWVHVFGAGSVFNLRGGYSEFLELSRSDEAVGFDAATLGFPPGLISQLPARLFPVVTMDDYVQLSRGANKNTSKAWSLQPNISITRGNHNIRSGLDMRNTTVEARTVGSAGMQIGFTRSFTQREFNRNDAGSGNSFASFLLGAPASGFIDNNVLPNFNWTFIAPWVQDDWKVTSKLTLNGGFRWDYNSPVSEMDDRLNYSFDPTIVNPVQSRINQSQFPNYQVRGGLTFVGVDGNPERPWDYDKNNFQLRGGFAYQINDRTVMRGGYGRYFLNPTNQGETQGFSLQTTLTASNDGNRTPTYALSNPFPQGLLPPPGSSLGPLTFIGRDITYNNNDFIVPYVDQFSIGIQRELPWNVSLEVSYAGSRSRDQETQFRGINEPSRTLQDQCDVTQGGSRAVCDQQLPNPFFQVPGFEGTSRFTSATLSRFELSRPFPQFGNIIETVRNDGKITYDSLQFVGNKRWAKGVTVNATYTWVPRFDVEGSAAGTLPNPSGNALNAFIDNGTRVLNESPYFTHRNHRITASGVYEFPFGQGSGGWKKAVLNGWSVAPVFIYQSGQPWLLPANTELVGDPSVKVERTSVSTSSGNVGVIYGVQPCVGQRNNTTGQYTLMSYSVAYGCTQPFFLIREPFQARETMFWDDRLRRPGYWQLDLNFAKTTEITDRVRFQVRLEAFNVFNSPMYDERDYNRDTNSADFGRINRNVTGQSNFQRFVQLGFRLIF